MKGRCVACWQAVDLDRMTQTACRQRYYSVKKHVKNFKTMPDARCWGGLKQLKKGSRWEFTWFCLFLETDSISQLLL
jgi:hypothetical protein